jgi:hypothetical protein
VARRRKTLEVGRIIELASKGPSYNHIAVLLGLSHDTLERNFAGVLNKGRATLASNLRAKQYEIAIHGKVRMLIWLGQQLLDQSENGEDCGQCGTLSWTGRIGTLDRGAHSHDNI